VALCPSGDCKAVSHLTCLATDFLRSDSSQSSGFLPRGGNCRSCKSYLLWGDVIRGCYRRHQGGKVPQLEESDREEDSVEAEAQNDDPTEDPIPTVPVPVKTRRVRITKGETAKRSRVRSPNKPHNPKNTTKRVPTVAEKDSESEKFDIGGFTDLDDSGSEMERRPPKPTPAKQGR